MGTLRNLHPDPNFIKSLVEEKSFENDPLVVVDVGASKVMITKKNSIEHVST